MKRKAIKIREFPLGGAKVNSTSIGQFLQEYFVVGDSHNNVRLFTFDNDEEIAVFTSPSNNNVQAEVAAVAFSTTEKQIFSGSNRGIINLWDMETAKSTCTLRGHSTAVNCFGIYADQPDRLASGSYDTNIKLWDLREKSSTATLKGHNKQINSIDISPDCLILLSGSQDNTVKLWDLRMPERLLFSFNQHNGPIVKAKFNPEDCMFATCSMDKTAKYFRCEEKHFGFVGSTDMLATPITAIGYNSTGKFLYTAANDSLKVWNMYKNGLLLETVETNWKNVQDLAEIKGVLMGIASSAGMISLWVCDMQKSMIKNKSEVEQASFVLPKINRNNLEKDNQQLKEILQNVNVAVDKVNNINIEDRPRNINSQDRKRQDQKKRLDELKIKFEQEKELEKVKERERREREKKQEIEKIKRMEEQQKILEEKMSKQRIERDKALKEKLEEAFEQQNLEHTLEHDVLESSSIMNLSAFVGDGAQRQKLKQVQIIGEIMKDSKKFESVLKERANQVKIVIGFWKQGKISHALQFLNRSNENYSMLNDCVAGILQNNRFKSAVTPEVGIVFLRKLSEMMLNKHSTFVRSAMYFINQIVYLFKDELIKVKTFNPMTKVDLAREEKIAKYDQLIDEFLKIFKTERLKKYAFQQKAPENQELNKISLELYKNLEEVLNKIIPRGEPEPA